MRDSNGMPARNWHEVVDYMGAKDSRPYNPFGGSPKHSRVVRRGDAVAITYHDTDVVTYTEEGITLNSDGWYTSTTKRRMNDALCMVRVTLYQERGVWRLSLPSGSVVIYRDGIMVRWDGTVDYDLDSEVAEVERIRKLTKAINKYCDVVYNLTLHRTLPKPDLGDCWYCLMREVGTGKSLGDLTEQKVHLIHHLDRCYVPGSLIVNALREYSSLAMRSDVQAMWNGEQKNRFYGADRLAEEVSRSVRRYFKVRLGVGR